MTLSEHRHDAHHDLTWLVGALARALFAQAHDDAATMAVLQGIAACDFDAPPVAQARRLADACKWLPEAAVEALRVAEEPAMALAASLEHLGWRALEAADGEAAWTPVLGAAGPLRCPCAALSLLVCAPGAETALPRDDKGMESASRASVLFVLAGEAALTDAHGALHHVAAGAVVSPEGACKLRASGQGTPLLAAILHA